MKKIVKGLAILFCVFGLLTIAQAKSVQEIGQLCERIGGRLEHIKKQMEEETNHMNELLSAWQIKTKDQFAAKPEEITQISKKIQQLAKKCRQYMTTRTISNIVQYSKRKAGTRHTIQLNCRVLRRDQVDWLEIVKNCDKLSLRFRISQHAYQVKQPTIQSIIRLNTLPVVFFSIFFGQCELLRVLKIASNLAEAIEGIQF